MANTRYNMIEVENCVPIKAGTIGYKPIVPFRKTYGEGYLPNSTVAFRSSLPQPTTAPLTAVKTDRTIM